ncbi:MAG: DUF1800 domain-containing protein [Paracoccaceae bacterium]
MTDRAAIAAFRFGYGLPMAGPSDPAALLAQLTGPDQAALRWPAYGSPAVVQIMQAARTARHMPQTTDAEIKARKKAQRRAVKAGKALATTAAKAAMARALSGQGLRERMVTFWADHFTTVPRNRAQFAWPSALVEDAIRPNLAGRFGDMLVAVITHPGMLIYLDQSGSQGPASARGVKTGKGLNENLARELLELHTLGVGAGYSQDDVRQMAELLTGLTVSADQGFAFDPKRAEPGAEVVLGVEYGTDGVAPVLAALQDLALRPETARHIAGKLAVHFVSDTPDPTLVDALAQAWIASGGDLTAVTQTLLAHPAAWTDQAEKARQPYDFIIASLRALGLGGDDVVAMADKAYLSMIEGPMAQMGQPWQTAPGPDGWPEEAAAWISPQGMAARISWAMEMPGKLAVPLPAAAEVAARALGARASERLLWAISAAESRHEALGLVLAAPEFNRR